jgi:predicted DNA-binding protein (MmcQ/YjbR family)
MCGKETKAASESKSKSKAPTIVKNISTDVKIATSTFGLGGQAQKDKIVSLGYSPEAAEDYQARSKASMARALAEEKRISKKRSKQAVATTTTDTDDTDTTETTATTTTNTTTERETDIGGAGTTSVTAESIYTRDPEEAMSDQEKLAQAELRRQRQQRAIGKAERLRTRLESAQKFGPQGRRGGRGRRSLMTGSRGGIGYYSRFK